MSGEKVLDNFTKKYRVVERKKAKISGNFERLNVGDIITIQMHPWNDLHISYVDDGHTFEFNGYVGNIKKSLFNFELEEV
jgi:hypothetical protein